MKKITFLFAFIALAAFAMAQMMPKTDLPANNIMTKSEMLTPEYKAMLKGTAYFTEDFEGTENWTLGSLTGTKTWVVSDQDGAPAGWEPSPGSYYFEYLGDYSATGNDVGGHWAWIDGISDLLNETGQISDTYIQFDGIDLTGVDAPQLVLYQLYRPLNEAYSYVDLSTDGGTTWTEVQVNGSVPGNDYAPLVLELLIGEHVANEANVSMRFRWQTTATDGGGYGYGWQIDDIFIVDAPNVDLEVKDTRVNFFYHAGDYNEPGNENLYHYSSHYGHVPQAQYDSEFAVKWFNIAVENKAASAVVPSVTVQILDPNMDEVYFGEIDGVLLEPATTDTIDLIEDFYLGIEPMMGMYTVAFEVFVEGEEDEWPADNVDTAFFYVTDGIYSRDSDNIMGSVSPLQYVFEHGDGDMIGTEYYYLYETNILNMQVFIDADTDIGTMYLPRILEWTEDGTATIATGTLQTVEEANLGEWVTLDFIGGAVPIEFEDGDDAKIIIAAVEIFYEDGNSEFWVGSDNSNNYSRWSIIMYVTSEDDWYLGSSRGIGIRLHENPPVAVEGNEISNNISVYPNPTTGVLNIDNVKGANLEIINIMGQTVESIYNANEFNTVDISNYANGSYILRVIDGNNVNTFKINLVD
jgi:hypothetical protein